MKKTITLLLTLIPAIASANITVEFPGGRLLYQKEIYREGDTAPILYVPEGQFIRILPKVQIRRGEADGKLYARSANSYPKTGITFFDFDLGDEVVVHDGSDVGAGEYILGPSAVGFRTWDYLIEPEGLYIVEYYSLTESGDSSATIRGLNPVLEMSLDLENWVPYEPGSLPEGVSKAFFRVTVDRGD